MRCKTKQIIVKMAMIKMHINYYDNGSGDDGDDESIKGEDDGNDEGFR